MTRAATALRVLYVHHAGVPTGAGRSLLELLDRMPPGAIEPHFVAPSGPIQAELRARGIPCVEVRGIAQWDDTAWGHYRGVRWLVLLRELLLLPATLAGLREAHRRWTDIDVVHVNEVTLLPAVTFARRLFRKPIVVHVRSVQRGDARGLVTRWVWRTLRKHATAFVAIDDTVQRSLPTQLPAQVIRNSFSPNADATDDGAIGDRIRQLGGGSLKVGYVGSLLRLKGVFELVQAAAICRDAGIDASFFIVGGDVRRFDSWRGRALAALGLAEDVGERLRERIAALGLADRVHLLGFTENVASVYRAIDVLSFCSHLDAPGRSVFEAALQGVPSIVAVRRPTPDTFRPEVTGIGIEVPDPAAIAAAVGRLAGDRALRRSMGEAARALAVDAHDGIRNAQAMLVLYGRVANDGCRPANETITGSGRRDP